VTRSVHSSPVLERRSNSFSQQSVGRQSPVPSAQAPSWLDYAKIRYGGSHHDAAVEDVKRLGIILILFICLLPYWLVFFQVHYSWNNEMLIFLDLSIVVSCLYLGLIVSSFFFYTYLFSFATINFWYKRRTGALPLLLYVTFWYIHVLFLLIVHLHFLPSCRLAYLCSPPFLPWPVLLSPSTTISWVSYMTRAAEQFAVSKPW